MAKPQYAMAHCGSPCATMLKAFSAAAYWNECSSATPVSNTGPTSALQVMGNDTFPSPCAAAGPAESWAENRGLEAIEIRKTRANLEGNITEAFALRLALHSSWI